MDWLSFISTTVGHLAWPTAIVGIVVLLRKQASSLFLRLEKLKHGETELVFREELKKASEIKIEEPKQVSPSTEIDEIDKIASINPAAGILMAFRSLETELDKISKSINPEWKKMPVKFFLSDLRRHHILSQDHIELVERLQRARNVAAHAIDKEISYDEYIEFRDMTKKVINKLNLRTSNNSQ